MADSNDEGLIGNTLLTKWDVVTVSIYLILVVLTGVYSWRRSNKNTETGYFLAGRSMWWLPVGASLFASNIGSEHFIGLAGSGAASGISVGAFELNALIMLQVLGWIFLPVFIASGVTTLPQYMRRRFGGKRIETSLAIFSLVLYIFTKISVNLYSGGIFIQQALRWKNLYASVLILLMLTAILTITGGLTAVIYTDTLQFFIMNVGSIYLAIKAFNLVGGYDNLKVKYIEAIADRLVPNTTCGIPRHDSWVVLRDADPAKSDMPWIGFILGQTPASIWYWCADQMMVQRVMASKSLSHAQGGTLFAGVAKLLPLFIMVMPGMVSRVLFPNEVGCGHPEVCQEFCGADTCSNYAYTKLVFEYMPPGMKGVMLSVMLSALISDLTSIFNSSATLFTMDIWTLFRPTPSEKEKVYVGKGVIIFLVLCSIAWVPVIEQMLGGEMYIYIQSVAAYLSPPIAAVYTLAILWARMNESGAFWGLVMGFIIGCVRMFADFMFKPPTCFESDTRPLVLRNFHYMYFATFLFWITVVISVTVSLFTKPTKEWRLIRTTYATRYDTAERKDYPKQAHEKNQNFMQLKDVSPPSADVHSRSRKSDQDQHTEDCERNNHHFKMETPQETEARLLLLSTLQQKTWHKVILRIMLVLLVATSVSMFVTFSINPFTEEEIFRLQQPIILRNLNSSGS